MRLTGELHAATIPAVRQRVRAELERSQELILDIERVSFIDSAGLGYLMTVQREVLRRGGRWALVSPTGSVARVLAITRADRFLPLFSDRSAVESAWGDGEPPARRGEARNTPERTEPVHSG